MSIIPSIIMAVLYVGAAIYKLKEIPESISSLVYVFKYRWLWTIWLWAVTLLTLIPCTEILSRIGMEFLGFGTMVCLCFCGAVPLFDKENEQMHMVCGISGCVLSQACVYFIDYQWLFVWMVFLFLMGSTAIQPRGWLGKMLKGKCVFLAEICCYTGLIGALLAR